MFQLSGTIVSIDYLAPKLDWKVLSVFNRMRQYCTFRKFHIEEARFSIKLHLQGFSSFTIMITCIKNQEKNQLLICEEFACYCAYTRTHLNWSPFPGFQFTWSRFQWLAKLMCISCAYWLWTIKILICYGIGWNSELY